MKKQFQGFSKLNREERLRRLLEMGALEPSDLSYLESGGLKDFTLAEHFIENAIGYFQLPLGVATNFRIDGRERVIPMAVEETSIIAAASKTAKWIGEHGELKTECLGSDIIGQIQLDRVANYALFKEQILHHKQKLIEAGNREVAAGLVSRGGGVTDIVVRSLNPSGEPTNSQGESIAVVHVLADPVDAMGANIMNQLCEFLKAPIEELTGEKVSLCILSNLVDTKLTRARVEMQGIEPELCAKIERASRFAELDPYRAATSNKGVLNGIDPILIATGNDWRAVEAGVHAYAARSGQYRSITRWRAESDKLVGEMIAPIVVGTVGGVTQLHPTARLCLKMLEVGGAAELSRVAAAVGLTQNLGALRALTSVGIIEGHMKLHIRNLSLGVGATEAEMAELQIKMAAILNSTKRISMQKARQLLAEIRRNGDPSSRVDA